ncbi:MAG TPA: hypothetical protein VI259_20125 [Gemmatimonadaceae bacterium]
MLTAACVALLFGRILTADSEPAAGLRVVVQWSRTAARALAPDTLGVDRYGRFATLAPEFIDDSVVVSIVAAADSRYYPTRIVVSRSRLADELRVLVLPREWTIRRGRFAGSTVRIIPGDALRRTPDFGSFGRVTNQHVVGWDASSFPLRVVLRHDMAPNISARDSIAFWEAAHEVEESIGLPLFAPTSDTIGDNRVFPIDVRLDPGISPSGLTFVSWDRTGRLFEGSVRFRTSREIERPSVVAHELLHALGFGHTTAWPSAMQARGIGLPAITAEDAAFAQLLMRVHDLQDDPLLVGGLLETAATVSPISR